MTTVKMPSSQLEDAHLEQLNLEQQGIVSKILTFSCVDGPGNRLVIFLQGCNFDCITCHNPQTINRCNDCGDCVPVCPTNALTLVDGKIKWDQSLCTDCDNCIIACPRKSTPKTTRYSVAQLLTLLEKHHFFLNGITVSGGEATMQLDFVIALFKAIKASPTLSHLSCFIDSNGYLSTRAWLTLIPYLDGAMVDLKAWQNDTHLWLTGRNGHRILKTIDLLAEHDKLHEVRLLYIPNKTDLLSEIDAVASYLKALPEHVKIRLNAFAHHGVIGEGLTFEKCSEQQMLAFSSELGARIQRELLVPTIYT